MKQFNTKKVGWIGLGQMGEPMVGHLLAQGVAVDVYNRTAAKAQTVVAKGAKCCDSGHKQSLFQFQASQRRLLGRFKNLLR